MSDDNEQVNFCRTQAYSNLRRSLWITAYREHYFPSQIILSRPQLHTIQADSDERRRRAVAQLQQTVGTTVVRVQRKITRRDPLHFSVFSRTYIYPSKTQANTAQPESYNRCTKVPCNLAQ